MIDQLHAYNIQLTALVTCEHNVTALFLLLPLNPKYFRYDPESGSTQASKVKRQTLTSKSDSEAVGRPRAADGSSVTILNDGITHRQLYS